MVWTFGPRDTRSGIGVHCHYLGMELDGFDDIIHAHDWLFALEALRAREKQKLAVTVHSTVFNRERFFNKKIYETEKKVFGKADAVITVSYKMKKILTEKYGIDSVVIPNGVDLEKFNCKGDGKTILFSGRLVWQKGPEYLLYAIPRILEEHDCTFVFCGEGYLLEPLKKFAEALGVDRFVSFEGFVEYSEIQEYYSRCRVFVAPGISEPFGLSVLEAMASGKPVVLSDAGLLDFCSYPSIPSRQSKEIVREVCYLLENERLRKSLGRRGRRIARELTWEKVRKRTAEVYESLERK